MFLFTMLSPLLVTDVTGHCMCDCTLRLRRTDHAPMMWLRPGQSQATAAAAWQSSPLIGHSDAANRPHWPMADSPVLEQALREMRLRTLFKDEDCKKEIISGPLCVSAPFVYSYVTLSVRGGLTPRLAQHKHLLLLFQTILTANDLTMNITQISGEKCGASAAKGDKCLSLSG